MKMPIEAQDVLKGDLIRKEFSDPTSQRTAVEYRATSNAHGVGGVGQHYLLNRPAPLAELPTHQPTFGWLHSSTYDHLSRFRRDVSGDAAEYDAGGYKVNTWYGATAFTPAVAVPKAALDELRAEADQWSELHPKSIVGKFLTAVDKAGVA